MYKKIHDTYFTCLKGNRRFEVSEGRLAVRLRYSVAEHIHYTYLLNYSYMYKNIYFYKSY